MFLGSVIVAAIAGISGALAQGTGDGTWYNTGLGSCGIYNTDADFIVAVPWQLFDTYPGATQNPNLNPICGRTITASYQGKSIQATITDRCGGCTGGDLDFSPAAFQALIGPLSIGRVHGVSWTYNGGSPVTTKPATPTKTTTNNPPATTTYSGQVAQCLGFQTWSASVGYYPGVLAVYNGHLWGAMAYTIGEVPGTTANWREYGKCL